MSASPSLYEKDKPTDAHLEKGTEVDTDIDPTLQEIPNPSSPLQSPDKDYNSFKETLQILKNPLVRNVLEDETLMKFIIERNPAVMNTDILYSASIKALMSDQSLIQRISALGVGIDGNYHV